MHGPNLDGARPASNARHLSSVILHRASRGEISSMIVPSHSPARISHFFTVDVEEYFQVRAFESAISREEWPRWPQRLDRIVPRLLDVMQQYRAGGTFFVLGWEIGRAHV